MQENKFRGISQYTGEMVYGQLLRGENNFNIVTNFSRAIDIELVPIKKGTQGQFIGLKDKNDKEIYIGDIVNCFIGYRSVVVFKNSGFCLETNGTYDWIGVIYGEMEVIGNIYENPELLEKVT